MKKIVIFLILMVAFLYIIIFLSTPYLAYASEGQAVNISGKISLGYDQLKLLQTESRDSRSFVNLYLDCKLPLFRQEKSNGILRLQNGLKLFGNNDNIALNQVDLGINLLLLPRITSEIIYDLRNKNISSDENSSLQTEYGYLYWHSGIGLKFNGNDFNSGIKYLCSRRNYADADFFNSKKQQIQLTTNISFSRALTGYIMGKVELSRFSRPQDGLTQEKHQDTLYEVSIGSQWLSGLLINPGYAFQQNQADPSEYSFNAHQFSLLTALPIYWDITLQAYWRWQICQYESQTSPLPTPLDEDNAEQWHRVVVLSLSRDIFSKCSLELRYALSETDLASSSTKYKKQSYSFTISYLF